MTTIAQAEYIWLDGAEPTQGMRSKTRFLPFADNVAPSVSSFPEWSFDGSSTYQALGEDSDLILRPVSFCVDPTRVEDSYLVLCEVFNPDGKTPHKTNQRAELRRVLDQGAAKEEPWMGFEQEYTFFKDGRPLGWPETGYPAPQGPYYCGVGAGLVHGRQIVEDHMLACVEAGLMIYGVNAEVMPGQWEFQVGYRGMDEENAGPLAVSDHTWLARWLLHRIAEDSGVRVSYDVKPISGDWNGAGMHTNFSTTSMRSPKEGRKAIDQGIERLSKRHEAHIAAYGHGLDQRLTGLHETCSINEFRSGVANRGASIRIPRPVELNGHGYLEDRRPGANADPYVVSAMLLKSICNIS